MISHPVGSTPRKYDVNDYINELDWGSLPLPERSILVEVLRSQTKTSELCWFCVWDGFGDLDLSGVSERVWHPGRSYALYRGPKEKALAPLSIGPNGYSPSYRHSPNLWWPDDRAWTVATEIDYAWTYVGGSTGLIESVLATEGVEALPVQLTDKPFFDSDTVNAALDAL
jgi:hypothetical protein